MIADQLLHHTRVDEPVVCFVIPMAPGTIGVCYKVVDNSGIDVSRATTRPKRLKVDPEIEHAIRRYNGR